MKRPTGLILIIAIVLVLSWMITPPAAADKSKKRESKRVAKVESEKKPKAFGDGTADVFRSPSTADVDEADDDPDLPARQHGNVDKATYLRLRDEYIARRRGIEPGWPFDPTARTRAIQQMEEQEAQRLPDDSWLGKLRSLFGLVPDAGGTWTAIGPAPLNVSAQGGGSIAVTGRATAIAVDPTNASNVYLGTAQGGVWRSLDGGVTWTNIFDSAQSLAIGSIAVAPSSPTTVYVGTGEPNQCLDCFLGVGLYRIDNADTSATLVGPINPQITLSGLTYNIFTGRSIAKILVHPTDPATIFVSTGLGFGGSSGTPFSTVPPMAPRGLFRSTNATAAMGSVTFTKLVVNTDSSLDSPETGNASVIDMVMEPGNPNNILAAVIGRTGTFGGIYRSTNALAATPTFTQTLTLPAGVRAALAINNVSSTITVYAATSETPSGGPSCTSGTNSGALRKSTDGGATFSGQLTGGGGFCGGQCLYDIAVGVNPSNANEVYLAGSARGTCSDAMKKSTNGGATFTRDDSGLHADSHALVYDGGGNIFTANDGGVWKRSATAGAGAAWTNLNTAPLSTIQFESVAVHPTDRNFTIGGTQDNGTEAQQTSPGNWQFVEGGDGGYALIDQSATDLTNVTMYHTFYNLTGKQIGFDRTNLVSCLAVTNSWESRGFGLGTTSSPSCDGTAFGASNGIQGTDDVLFYAPMALGPGTPNTLYFGTDRLYRSTDRGDTMVVASQAPISATSPISTIGISPQDDTYRIVGLDNGQVWATSTASSTLVNITSGSFPSNPNGNTSDKFVGRAVIDPNNKNVAYVTFSFFAPAGQGAWKITNLGAAGGASPAAPVWTAVGNGIPSIPINAFVVDPTNSSNLFAGTDIGVYNSTDGGVTWSPFGTGLPRIAVFDMALQNPNRVLRIATHGRGMWEISLGVAPTPTWESVVLTPSQVEIKTWTFQGRTYAYLKLLFPNAGYRVVDFGQAVRAGNDFTGDAAVERFTGASVQSLTTTAGIYDLGVLTPGSYNFIFKNSSTVVKTLPFIVAAPPFPANPIDTAREFVKQQYRDFLNREADQAGEDFWTDNITLCSNPARRPPGQTEAQCTTRQRETTSGAFFQSPEFQYTGYFVYRMYQGALGRQPKLSEFIPDAQFVGAGILVNSQLSAAKINQNKADFAAQFVNCTDATKSRCAEFKAIYDGMNNQQYVDALFVKTGANPSASERSALVNGLNAGPATETRASVLQKVVDGIVVIGEGNQTFTTTYGQAFYNSESNRAFVQLQYFGYMKRDPDDAGYAFWLGKLNQFNGNFVNAEMVLAFISSPEYRARFGQP